MRVYYRSGIAECFACKQKWTFDDVASALGLEPFIRDPMRPLKSTVIMANLPDPDDDPLQLFDRSGLADYIQRPLPKDRLWRSIPTNLLIAVGCKLMEHREWGTKYIFMPTMINGEMRGYTRARMHKVEGKPTYIHAGGAWSKLDGLFPYDFAVSFMKRIGSSTMVGVEGQRDALRLLYEGIPAVCILGTNSWSDNKAILLDAAGVTRFIPFMDGDDAGIGATDVLVESASKFMEVKAIRLWKIPGNPYPKYAKLKVSDPERAAVLKKSLWDPGNCPIEIIHRVKKTFFR